MSATTGALVGVEAFVRFVRVRGKPPAVRFSEAQPVGLSVASQMAAIEAAAGLLDELRSPAFLAITLAPDTIATPELQELLIASAADRIVLMLTEPIPIEDHPRRRGVLRHLRGQGVRVAVKVSGAGLPILGGILGDLVPVAPDLIVLERHFTGQISVDPLLCAQAGALVSFADATGAKLIASGIETTEELQTVRTLGIPLAQGHLVAPPATLSSLPRRFPEIARLPDPRLR